MASIVNSILRAFQFIWTLLTLALSSALINQQFRGGTPTRVNFSVFASVFAILSLFYLIPAVFMSSIAHPIAIMALDALNTIFFLSAAIAMASQLSGTSCGNGFHLINNGITNGGGYFDQEKRCREAQAMTAFFWFGFAAFLGSFVLAVVAVYQARKAGMRTSGPSRVNMGGVRPSMSMAQP